MEKISIRLPYVEDEKYALAEAESTDLSHLLDKDRFRFNGLYDNTIMLIYEDPNYKTKGNLSFYKDPRGYLDIDEYKTWYEYLLPILKLSKEDFERLAKTADNDNIVEFGYFPSKMVININEEERLRQCKRKFTGNRYTLPISSYYKGRKKVEEENKFKFVAKRIVDLESFPEYEIDGERYIEYREWGGKKSYFFKVKPLRWNINTDTRELMCTTLPVNGIIYNDFCGITKVSYNDSLVRKYLEENFLKEAILNHIKEEEKIPPQTNEVTKLLKEIRTYKEQYHGTEDINEIIRDIIKKYNEDLESLKSKSGLTLYTEKGLYLKLLSDLNRILDKLKRGLESSKEYCDILKLIEDSITALEGQQKETNNELLKDIQKISTELLPKLSNNSKKQEEIKKRILKELTSDRDKVKSYLEYINVLSKDITLSTSKNLGFKTLSEYETSFRIRLHPILESIFQLSLEEEKQVLIDKKNEVLRKLDSKKITKEEVNYELFRILETHYKSNFKDCSIVNTLLKEINRLVKELKSYSVRPEPAFNVDIPNDDLNGIVESLDTIITNLHKMLIAAKTEQRKVLRINSYKVNEEL